MVFLRYYMINIKDMQKNNTQPSDFRPNQLDCAWNFFGDSYVGN